jgi:hypothetical protein
VHVLPSSLTGLVGGCAGNAHFNPHPTLALVAVGITAKQLRLFTDRLAESLSGGLVGRRPSVRVVDSQQASALPTR